MNDVNSTPFDQWRVGVGEVESGARILRIRLIYADIFMQMVVVITGLRKFQRTLEKPWPDT